MRGCMRHMSRADLTVGAVYRLLRVGRVSASRAIAMLESRGVRGARQTVEIWCSYLKKRI